MTSILHTLEMLVRSDVIEGANPLGFATQDDYLPPGLWLINSN